MGRRNKAKRTKREVISKAKSSDQPEIIIDQSKTSQVGEQRESQNRSYNTSRHLYEDPNGTICEKCKSARGGAWVVQCDGCDRWFHFNCVKFNSEEVDEDEPWFCDPCLENQILMSKSYEISDSRDKNDQNAGMGERSAEPAGVNQRESFDQEAMIQSMMKSFVQWNSMQEQISVKTGVEQQRDSTIEPQSRMNPQVAPLPNESSRYGSMKHGVSQRVITTTAQVHQQPLKRNPSAPSEVNTPIPFNVVNDEPKSVDGENRDKRTTAKPSFSIRDPSTKASVVLSDAASVSFKSASSKRTSSSQRRMRVEQKLQAEFELQAELDEEKIALKLEALMLRESRERKFLDEKFKAMNEESSSEGESEISNGLAHSKPMNDTGNVLAWIEKQRKQRSQNAQLIPHISIDVSDREMKTIVDRQTIGTGTQKEYRPCQPTTTYGGQSAQHHNGDASQSNTQCVRINSTFVNDNQPTTMNHDQRYVPIPHSIYQTNGEIHQKSNECYQANAKTTQCTVNPSTNQLHQNVKTYHGQNSPVYQQHCQPSQSSINPPIVSSQQYAFPTSQQNPMFSSGPLHQSNFTSSQFVQGSANAHQQVAGAPIQNQSTNMNQLGTRMPGIDEQLSSDFYFGSERPQLTTNQIAARHVVAKKLPTFYGNPREWPDFIQRFISTTKACGFDNMENLDRLSQCLDGKAKDIVRSQLSTPDCVPAIIETLRQKYGRKEIVVKAVLKEIREEPLIKADKLEALSDYGYKVQNACLMIQRLQMHFYLYNPELIQELVDKLPHQTKIEWARYSDNIPEVTLATLADWLVTLSRSINRITTPEVYAFYGDRKNDHKVGKWKGGTYINSHNDDNGGLTSTNRDHETNQASKCEYCLKVCKSLAECSKFKKASLDEKWKFLYDQKKICRGCLHSHQRKCTKAKECGVNGCSFKHHPMLHDNEKMLKTKNSNQSPTQPSTGNGRKSDSHTNSSCNAHSGGQAVLYKIIPVTLKNGSKIVSTHAYIDEGSGLTLMESELADKLDLKGTPQKLCLRWTSGKVRQEKDSMKVVIGISGVGDNQHNYQIRDVSTVKSLDLPKQNINKTKLTENYPYLERIPFHNFDASPKILIGLDNIKLGVSRECVEGRWTEPIASKTLLGWVVHGQNGQLSGSESQHMQHHVLSINQCQCQTERDDELHQQIEEFFSLENFGIRALTNSTESKEVQRAIQIMENTTIRKNRRFETGLLWKFDDIKFPNNLPMALKRLECQDRRMQSNPELMGNINNQIRNFILKGYARKLTPDEINVDDPRIWYLPVFHHLDPKKPEKVRLVWDAAAKYKGISLNSMLMTGPDNLVALIDVLRRFREKCIAIGGDLEEMYHQIQVRQQDRNSQRFLWRDGKLEATPDVYSMDVLPFGTKCSPSLAQSVKNKNASEFENEYPEAARAIQENHYVDDWLDSQHTVEDTIRLAKQVKYVHQQGGFNLRKFISNSEEVLNALGGDNGQMSKDLNVTTTLSTQRVLGIWWNAQTDCFTFSLRYTKLNEEVLLGLRAPTKREVLKTLMSIYDPLGLIAFFLVYLKVLLQEVWKAKVAWDQQLTQDLNKRWQRWVKFLPLVENVRIPRLYSNKISPGTAQSIELHTVVDAGKDACCAACYLRIIDQNGVDCVLIGAKTKVAPIKPVLTIPRLELLAAVLGTRLAKSIEQSLTLNINKRYFWSDSRDVLCWIRSTTRKYHQFVTFRIGEILETTNEQEWRWVPGKLNVADDGTKWSKTPNFDPNCRWFCGPEYLYGVESSWPQDLPTNSSTEEEIHVHLVHTKLEPPSRISPENFSNWSRLIHVQAL